MPPSESKDDITNYTENNEKETSYCNWWDMEKLTSEKNI